MDQVARYVAGTEDQPTKQCEGQLADGVDLFTLVTFRLWPRRPLRSLTTGAYAPSASSARQRDRDAGERAQGRHRDRLE